MALGDAETTDFRVGLPALPARTGAQGPLPDPRRGDPQQPAVRPTGPAKREGAMFKHFKALQRASPGPTTITTITATALVIITL